MSKPTTPPAGLASGAHCLAAGAWSTRRQTAPHTHPPPPPPPDPKAPQQRAHHTHRHGGISLPRVPPRGLGAASSPARLETATAGSAQPSRVAGTVVLTVGPVVRGRR